MRQFVESDFTAFAEMCASAEIMRYLRDGSPITRTAAWFEMVAFLGHWTLRGFGEWAVEERSTGTFVGRIGLQQPEGWPEVEVGWVLHPAHWGKGFATEGATVALDIAFARLRSKRVISMIHPDNAASIRVAERLGEKRSAIILINGRTRLVYAIEPN